MESVKVLHCADLHLGAPFSSLPPGVAAERSNDLRRVFMRIVEMCKTDRVQLLLVSGDLFDSVHISDSLSDMVRNAFNSIPGTFVAIAPGNHDPAVFDSPYRNKESWPRNVFIFTDGLSYLDLSVMNVRLWGVGFTHVYQHQPLLISTGFTDTDMLNICVMHGDLVQTGGSSAYNPITAAMIADCGMDYLALGHVHKRSEILKAGSVFYAYPGSPEGLGFDEKGDRGVYMGEIARGVCDMRFYALNRREYVDIHIQATGLARQEIIQLIRDKLRTDKTRAVDDMIRINMTGDVTEDSYVSPEYVTVALADVFYVNINDQTRLDVHAESGGHDFTLRNIFVRKMLERIEKNPSDESLKLAMKLGLRAFTEKVAYTFRGI